MVTDVHVAGIVVGCLIAGILIGLFCGILGCWLKQRREVRRA